MSNWSHDVTTRRAGTFPPEGTFTKRAKEIYLIMRRPEVSPNGLGSAIQMTQFFINRAGVNLSARQERELRKAIAMLQVELEYLKQAEACQLDHEPTPVYPAPPPEKRVGGDR